MGQGENVAVTRREFIKSSAVLAAAPLGQAVDPSRFRFDHTADVVIAGAGASGLAAAIAARDTGASVLVIEENYDIGGHAMLSGGRINLGGGTSLQKKYGVADSVDQVFLDHADHLNPMFRYADRALVRMWAEENVSTFEFLIENGIIFNDVAPTTVYGAKTPRLFIAQRYSDNLKETINGRAGSGVVRPLEASARKKGVRFLLSHKLVRLLTQSPTSGPVHGLVARVGDKEVMIRARKGVILCTGGHTSDVTFRRMFDPRLTEEYQVTGEPWTRQGADGEKLAIGIGAAIWGAANQQYGLTISKTFHIGARYGYENLKWNPASPVFPLAKASGLTVRDFQDVILVNQVGARFWNEMDGSDNFKHACLGTNGDVTGHAGGGPIWAVFDVGAVEREGWDPVPPNVDPDGWFFSANSLSELAAKIKNPYQRNPMSGAALEATVARYNASVAAGADRDFNKPEPKFKIEKPPFYAGWSTPILHDSLAGLRINTKCQVIDVDGKAIAGLFCAGEVAGGFGLHGLPRVLVFGRVAGREAAGIV